MKSLLDRKYKILKKIKWWAIFRYILPVLKILCSRYLCCVDSRYPTQCIVTINFCRWYIVSCICMLSHVSIIISAWILSLARIGTMSRHHLCLPTGRLEKPWSTGLREQVRFLFIKLPVNCMLSITCLWFF